MFRLREIFLTASTIAFFLVGGVLVVLHDRIVHRQMEHHAKASNLVAAKFMENALWPQIQDYVLNARNLPDDKLRSDPEGNAFCALTKSYMRDTGLTLVEFIDPTGRIVLSTDEARVGQRIPERDGFATALSGKVGFDHTHLDIPDTKGNEAAEHELAMNFVPLRGDDGDVQAVIRVQSDVANMVTQIERMERTFLLLSVLVVCVLFGVLWLTIEWAQRVIKRQHKQITAKQTDLEKANEALSVEISERKDAQRLAMEVNATLERRVKDRTKTLIQREAALFESENRFRDFADASSDWYWEMDESLRFSYFSDRFQAVTGIEPNQLLGKNPEEVPIANVDPKQWRTHLEALHNRQPFRNFIRPGVKDSGETVWLSINGVPYFDEFGKFQGFRGTGNDISNLVEAQQQAEQARHEAEDANRAKSEFLANMSHELRTPLNAIIGYAELLQEEAEERQDVILLEDLTKVQKAGKHLHSLINNVLDLSKIEASKMEVTLDQVNLPELVTEVADTVRPLIEEGGNRFSVDNASVLQHLITDGQKLRQTLLNLLGNAAKFTRSGAIDLEVTEVGPDRLRFIVSDTGIGMTKEQIDEIFEPFAQGGAAVNQQYGGTGLGLTLCKRYTEMLHGDIDVESKPGQGSRFSITLRIHQVDADGKTALTA